MDSYVDPVPAPMPGYDSDVIMAAGAFVQWGSSIELSADGPVREPYAVYYQGGLTWYHAKLGVAVAAKCSTPAHHPAVTKIPLRKRRYRFICSFVEHRWTNRHFAAVQSPAYCLFLSLTKNPTVQKESNNSICGSGFL